MMGLLTLFFPSPTQLPMSIKYKIVQIPGKGEGLVATEKIKAEEVILKEIPMIIISSVHTKSNADADLRTSSKLNRKFAKLSQDQKAQFQRLHSEKGLKPGDEGYKLDIFKSNALPMPTVGDPHAAAIFGTLSKVNSSCRANSIYWWMEAEKKGVLRCVRDIQKGEEVTIFYLNSLIFGTREERQTIFRQRFSCSCQCEVCSLTGEELQRSDERRNMLKCFYKAGPALIGTAPTDAIRFIKMADQLLTQEGLLGEKGELYYDAFEVCLAWSDYKNAKIWGQRAVAAFEREQGPTGTDSVKAKRFLEELDDHPISGSFGIRSLSS